MGIRGNAAKSERECVILLQGRSKYLRVIFQLTPVSVNNAFPLPFKSFDFLFLFLVFLQASTFTTMLNRNDGNRRSCPVPDFTEIVFFFKFHW